MVAFVIRMANIGLYQAEALSLIKRQDKISGNWEAVKGQIPPN